MFTKEKILIVVILFVCGNFLHCNVQNNDTSRKQLFDLNWKFSKSNQFYASGIDFNDQSWRSICTQNEIFVNGISMSTKQNKTNSFQAILNPYLNFNGKNVIAIQVIIPKEPENSWLPESGIYRHVWLVIKNTSDK